MSSLFRLKSFFANNDSNSTSASAKSIVSVSVSVYIGGWLVYYLTAESLRWNEIRRRSKKHQLKTRKSRWNKRSKVDPKDREPRVADESDTGSNLWFGGASPAEATSIRSRFSSFSILGRYQNPTLEWREQGLWELIIYKSIFLWQSRGRVWSDGGFSKDTKTLQGREKIERLLPVTPLDCEKLWGKGYQEKSEQELEATLKEKEIVEAELDLDRQEKGEQDQPAAEDDRVSYTWIGQSTCLIQIHGLTILTDPVLHPQPIPSLFSPTRLRPLPTTISSLLSGRIDLVLLSHNHFDHLDLAILKFFRKETKWIVPQGVQEILRKNGLKKEVEVEEADWWQEIGLDLTIPVRSRFERGHRGQKQETQEDLDARIKLKSFKISLTPVPALHWTGRKTPLDTNTTLWCSYALRVTSARVAGGMAPQSKSLFFSCDTGYSASLYSSIGRLLGPIDIAVIPIGSYSPRWHMSIQHIDPSQAISIAQDIGAKTSFATHHGTWIMSEEMWDEPQRLLKDGISDLGMQKEWFRATGFGETIELE